jgi:O-antigen/teichoic acid export membrane protein
MPSPLTFLSRHIPGGAAISVVGVYLGVALNFLLNIIAARQLGTAAYGHVALGLALMNLLAIASQAGLSQSSSRFIGEYLAHSEYGVLQSFVRTVQWVPPLFGLAIGGVGFIIVWLLAFAAPVNTVLAISLLSVPALGSIMLSQNIARGFGRMVLATMPVPVLLPAAALLTFLAGPYAPTDAAGFMSWYAAILLVLMVGALLTLNLRQHVAEMKGATSEPAAHHYRRWWQVSWPMFVTALGQQFLRRADVLILAALVAPQTLGLYALGSRFAQVIAVARFSVNRYAMPRIAQAFAGGDLAEVEAGVRHSTRLVLGVSVLVIIALLAAGGPVLRYAGDLEGAAFGFMIIILAGQATASLRSASMQTLQMCGYERTANTIVLVSAPLLALAGSIATMAFGAIGMAVVVALLTASIYWFAAFMVRRLVRVDTAVLFPRRRRDAGSDADEH